MAIDLTQRWQVLNADCLDVLRELPDGCVDCVVTDPPYGIGYDPSQSTQFGIRPFSMIAGDEVDFDPSHLLHFPDVLLWGTNNYANKLGGRCGQWYCWDKVTRNGLGVRIAECEFAWHKNGTKPRVFRHLWSGAYRDSEQGTSFHPCQKPVALMTWCLEQMNLRPSAMVLDPYCGSGAVGIACMKMGLRYLGVEIEGKYADIARRRIGEAANTLWTPPAAREPEPTLIGAPA